MQLRLAAFLSGNVLVGVFSRNAIMRHPDERLQQRLRHVDHQEAGHEHHVCGPVQQMIF
ncbi:hypothetical protein NBRC3257_3358 [Gluconobacter thailandicus NBRC 3257]|uniref:Uncharacterized protein n=1 Tax=Gluconobacter thailandicus NBRC 3257 TaxID=1381097 RepID=A0ABQ0J1M8_GLUTH|nr:hypothetical protein NBRC3257_3358 [Gluconobacter thailandicus NBRC 3257]